MLNETTTNNKNEPIDKQFLSIHLDLDRLLELSNNTTKQIEQLMEYHQNQNDQVENLIRNSFQKWMKEKEFRNIDLVYLENRKFINHSKDVVVQWDGVFVATKTNDGHLFLLEINTPNNTMDNKKTLLLKIQNTLNFFKKIHDLHVSGELQKCRYSFRQQANMILEIMNYKINVVYASTDISKDIVNTIKDIKIFKPYGDNEAVNFFCLEFDHEIVHVY